jgi:hemerythrin-like domain-containing protein
MPALMKGTTAEALQSDAPADPIDRIVDEHFRQQALCHVLDRLARNPRHGGNREEIEEALDYLEGEMSLHAAYEKEDLLPLLGRRCQHGDRFGEISVALRENHASERALGATVLLELQRISAGGALANPAGFFASARRLTGAIRRHIIWENAVLVPLARRRLKGLDYPYLARKMADRHGETNAI